MCTEANRNYPFPGYIDISSLVVQDDYIFIQVGHGDIIMYVIHFTANVNRRCFVVFLC